MTTEIIVMNKTAIALAADSAVTVRSSSPSNPNCKIYNSANKLFALSKYAPVSLMIYGNATLMGIPWESIVKIYRDKIDNKTFSKLAIYCDNFIDFLDTFEISQDNANEYVLFNAKQLLKELRDPLDEWVKTAIEETKECSMSDIVRKAGDLIKEQRTVFEKWATGSIFTSEERKNFAGKYKKLIKNEIEKAFGRLPLTSRMISDIIKNIINAASIGPIKQSGVVIAGFGSKEIYPSFYNYDIAAIFEGKTIKRDGQNQAITDNMGAAITSFAQSNDVKTFMEGIGPMLSTFLEGTFYQILTKGLPERLCKEVGEKLQISPELQKETLQIAEEMCKGACDQAFEQLKEQQKINYIRPVIKATGFLNKAELATMAETLVNLESFRKQVTMEAETVGGPIDVAVITKGDGLVWIKRKQYFPPELNHHFFKNYYRKVDENEEIAQD